MVTYPSSSKPGRGSRLIAVTGGPGAGKTAMLHVAHQHFQHRVAVLPEAASLLFTGGFPRPSAESARRAAQRAIFHVQLELERTAVEDGRYQVVLCDRGTVDGAAYWPGTEEDFWSNVGSNLQEQLNRYTAVIHLRTPPAWAGYDKLSNPVRSESAEEAARLDNYILQAWAAHPRRYIVDWDPDFIAKLSLTLAIIRDCLPEGCRDDVLEHRRARFIQPEAIRR